MAAAVREFGHQNTPNPPYEHMPQTDSHGFRSDTRSLATMNRNAKAFWARQQ